MQHPTERKIVDIARRYLLLSLQANASYRTQQSLLELDLVLSQERLETADGTALSLQALASLAALTQSHKAAFQAVMLASSSEMAGATAELPGALRDQYNTIFLETTQWQLDAQSRFYAQREHWLATAIDICMLIEARRASCTFSESGVNFHDEEALALFDCLTARLFDASVVEREAYAARAQRLRESLLLLGMPSSA